ncbi:uncharacterized protein EI90DRAFT_3013555 [Cantharellus anzutake]|uniref:uncharacterized protein n=1 Tax=Cantharellus anzutake TaxID=1750568 RepID=UPI001905BE5D|nr:uncharacterized protein EI90DRAFT_3013555 [Cantharellus anzutake]KAF8338302.1 hypothetical protein EI90DRAFT_3013555 [Cantharellus anzutake]
MSIQAAHSTGYHDEPLLASTALPVEILGDIFQYLPLRDLIRSKLFLHVIEESLVLQYHIEREISLLAGTTSTTPTAISTELARLRRREAGWANLKWHSQTYIIPSQPGALQAAYRLQHGFLACGRGGSQSSRFDNCLWLQPLPRVSDRPSGSGGREPPSAFESTSSGRPEEFTDGDVEIDPPQPPILIHLGFGFRVFDIDPEQNLAVYICRGPKRGIIRLRQMFDNAPHPMARFEALNTPFQPNDTGSYQVSIFGDFIGVMECCLTPDGGFWIWNWKTGICQCEGSTASLEVYAFRPCFYEGLPTKPCLPSQHVATFQLPQSSSKIYDLPLRCEPNPIFEAPEYEILSTKETQTDKSVPNAFFPPISSVPATNSSNPPKQAWPTNGPPVRYSLVPFDDKIFVAPSDIYRMTKRFERDVRTSRETSDNSCAAAAHMLPVHVSWDDWGCRSARLVQISASSCHIFMNRFIFSVRGYRPECRESCFHLHLLDFNPYSVGAGSLAERSEYDLGELADENMSDKSTGSADMNGSQCSGDKKLSASHSSKPSRVSKDHRISGRMVSHPERTVPLHGRLFAHRVVSGLPYRYVMSDEPFQGWPSLMIDAERILIVNASQPRL